MKKKIIPVILIVLLAAFSLVGCHTPAASATVANSVTATPTVAPTPTLAPGPYQGVVLCGGIYPVMMSPFGMTSDTGTMSQATWDNGANHGYFWGFNVYQMNKNASVSTTWSAVPDGARYFTYPTVKEEDYKNRQVQIDAFNAATAAGQLPYVFGMIDTDKSWAQAPVGRAKLFTGLTPPKFPAKVTKVYFDSWMWDFPNYPDGGATVDFVTNSIFADIVACVAKIKETSPDVQVYVGGYAQAAKSFPRHDLDTFPKMDPKFATVPDSAKNSTADIKKFNAALQTQCDKQGYTLVNYQNSPLIGSDGYCKEEYQSPVCHGNLLNNLGVKIMGDYLMDAMKLPKSNIDLSK